MIGSAALSAATTLSQASAARKAAAQRAKAAEENARIAREEAVNQARRKRRLGLRERAGFRARLGGAGVTGAGSPVNALATAAIDNELDALNLLRQGELRARQSMFDRNDAILAGRRAKSQAVSTIGQSLLSTGKALSTL